MSNLDTYLLVTAAIAIGAALLAYHRTRDALHPAVFVGLLMAYGYGIWPLILNRDDELLNLFRPDALESVAFLYMVALLVFFGGMLWHKVDARSLDQTGNSFRQLLDDPGTRRKLFFMAIVLGLIAVAAYWHMIDNAGGFVKAYARVKGGGRAESGYIGEAILLAYPAILLLALSRTGQKVRLTDIVLALLFASPHLLQGTYGGRRGPLFLVLSVLFVAWFLARGTRPTLRTGFIGVSVIALAVIVVWSQRQQVYLGSGGSFEISRVYDVVSPQRVSTANEYVSGVATVLTTDYHGEYYWGYRYFVTFVIRPIPKQLWPTQYEDMGATWLQLSMGERRQQYLEAVGFRMIGGVSVGLVADLYMEFWWAALFALLLLGRFYGWMWQQHRQKSGVWSVIYLELMILSVYLPVQSFSAVAHRFLFMSIVTALVWRWWIARPSRAAVPQLAYAPTSRSSEARGLA